MIDKIQMVCMLGGLGMIIGAGVLGFGHGEWVYCLGLGGLGTSVFVFGTQHG